MYIIHVTVRNVIYRRSVLHEFIIENRLLSLGLVLIYELILPSVRTNEE